MVNSRAKGAAAEREFAAWLRERGITAKRGQQHAGGPDSPDVISELPYHLELKRVEALRLWPAIEQAVTDSGVKPPVVVHRANRRPWVCIMLAEDWLILVEKARKFDALSKGNNDATES